LGRGLGALIPQAEIQDTPGAGLQDLAVASIVANPNQPRSYFDEEAIAALADSIRELGVLQPLIVRPDGDDGFTLVAGERRLRAARRLGMQTVPAIVRDTDDATSLAHAIVENVQREDLNPLEEAAAYRQLIEEFGLTHEQVAARVGKSRATVTNLVRLLQLAPSIQVYVRDKRLQMGHARALLGTPDRAFQETLARRAVAEEMSVRAVEEAVREHERRDELPDDGAGGEGAGANVAPSGGHTPTALRPAGLIELEELLSDHLDTKVRVSMAQHHGRVVVDFANLEDLERIYRLMTEGKEARSPGLG
jgi:ParB family chromosome partitioning protein